MKIINNVLTFLTLAVLFADGCFIRNCPLGGKKRSVVEYFTSGLRKCPSCNVELSGEKLTGTCVSPDLCCLGNYGCFSNREMTNPCKNENLIPTPCYFKGKSCGSNGSGTCITNGVCCEDEGSCRLDAECAY